MATGAERVAKHRDRRRRQLEQFNGVEVSQSDVGEIAAIGGYEEIAAGGVPAAKALERFISDMVACLDRDG